MPSAATYAVRRSPDDRKANRPWAPKKGKSPLPPPSRPRYHAPPPPALVIPPPPPLVAPLPPPPPPKFAPLPPPPAVPPPPPLSPLQMSVQVKRSRSYDVNECVSSPSRPPTVSTVFSSGSDSDTPGHTPAPQLPSIFRTKSNERTPPPPPSEKRSLPPTISMPSPMRAPSPVRAPSPTGKICFPLPNSTVSMAEDDNEANSMRIPNFTLDEDLSHLSFGSDSCKTEEEKKLDHEDEQASCERDRLKNLTKERAFWNSIVTRSNVTLGPNHVRTAEVVMNLGIAELRCKDYDRAVSCFQSAGRIFKKLYGPSNLGLAKALDKIGFAASQKEPATHDRLSFALDSLEEALKIRTELLGASHVDTVDTMNNMAGVYLKLQKLQIAKQTFHDVLLKRIGIFDQMHPSVAVTAHTLASIHVTLNETEEAYHYFNFAYAVYRAIGLPDGHAVLAGILREVADLDSDAFRVSL